MTPQIIDYAELRKIVEDKKNGRSHLLLGNGFSIGCDPVFKYHSLYERAVTKGLSERAKKVFSRLGTGNFEGVMRLLDESHWVAHIYNLVSEQKSEMLADVEIIKIALVEAIADSHLDHTGKVSEAKKTAARKFLEPYWNVFTTNYDLLTYWVILSEPGSPKYRDCFGDDPDEPDAPHVIYSFNIGPQQGLFYLHGALHLFVLPAGVAKHCWSKTQSPLTQLIKDGMAGGVYPLFVAEGTSDKKLQQIHSNAYLAYCLDKFGRVKNRLVVFGHALGDPDDHIRRAIAGNSEFEELFISVRDAKNTGKADAAVAAISTTRQQRGLDPLKVTYFLADSTGVWG